MPFIFSSSTEGTRTRTYHHGNITLLLPPSSRGLYLAEPPPPRDPFAVTLRTPLASGSSAMIFDNHFCYVSSPSAITVPRVLLAIGDLDDCLELPFEQV